MRNGFSLMELMIVVVIMSIMMTIAYPFLPNLMEGTNRAGAVNAVSVATEAARAYMDRRPGDAWFDPLSWPYGSYEGCAAVFTSTDIRLVVHDREAMYDGEFLSRTYPDPAFNKHMAGYKDISEVEYVTFPESNSIVGVTLDQHGNTRFLAPPFAIKYELKNNMIVSKHSADLVYYDGNGDGEYDINSGRPSNYDPPTNPPFDNTHLRHELPFEKLELVIGVLCFENNENLSLRSDGDGYINQDTADRIAEKGTMILFNRYTGSALRNR